jgi:hypothetical protein
MTIRNRSRSRATFDRDAYERQIESFVAAVEEEEYANGAGLKDELAVAPIYAEHGALFSRAAVDELRTRVEAGTGQVHLDRALLSCATDGYLEQAVASLTDAIATAESRAVVIWRGEPIAYRSVRPRLASTADRGERNALFGAWLEAVEAINPLREERMSRIHQLTVDLGYASYLDLVETTRGWSPAALETSLRSALKDTETGYYAAMRRAMARIGIEQGDGSLADVWYLLRGAGWDAWFDGTRMVPVLAATLRGIGIDLDAQPGATLDLDPRPSKSPRAFCSPVRVPHDVRLVVKPQGGWDDFAATLHEAGHLEHFLHVDASLPAAARLLGDLSVTEGYAHLFENLLGEAEYLAEMVGMSPDDATAFVDFYALFALHRQRQLSGMFLYQLGLHRGGSRAVNRAAWSGTVGLLTGVHVPEELYLAQVDDGLYAGSYLRSLMLGYALAEALNEHHGPAWWRSPAAGEQLVELFARGQAWNAERVVAHLGYDSLDWRPVLRKIRTQLIGEMSGYGGPNITTRAGTRKV